MSVRHRLRTKVDPITKRDGRDGEGWAYPHLVIEVDGIDDVYRIARVLERAQVEFSEIGGSVLRGLDRRWPGIVRHLVARMGPTWGYPGRKPRARKAA